jgi:tetratricopeptide (TPR) repeat protein
LEKFLSPFSNNYRAELLEKLAKVYFYQNNYVDSENILKEALKIRELNKSDLSNLIRDLDDLAEINIKVDNYAKAEIYLQRVLTFFEQNPTIFTNNHLDSPLSSIKNYYMQLGKYDKVETIITKILTKNIEAKSNTFYYYLDLANINRDIGNFKKAEKLYDYANYLLIEDKKRERYEHLLTKKYSPVIYGEIALLREYQSKNKEAEVLYNRDISDKTRIFESNSLKTIESINNLREFLINQKREKESKKLLNALIVKTSKCENYSIVKEHSKPIKECTYEHFKYLGYFYGEANNPQQSEFFYNKALQKLNKDKNKYYELYYEIQRSKIFKLLAFLYEKENKYDKAEKILNSVLLTENSINSAFAVCTYDKLISLSKKNNQPSDYEKNMQTFFKESKFINSNNYKFYCRNIF